MGTIIKFISSTLDTIRPPIARLARQVLTRSPTRPSECWHCNSSQEPSRWHCPMYGDSPRNVGLRSGWIQQKSRQLCTHNSVLCAPLVPVQSPCYREPLMLEHPASCAQHPHGSYSPEHSYIQVHHQSSAVPSRGVFSEHQC